MFQLILFLFFSISAATRLCAREKEFPRRIVDNNELNKIYSTVFVGIMRSSWRLAFAFRWILINGKILLWSQFLWYGRRRHHHHRRSFFSLSLLLSLFRFSSDLSANLFSVAVRMPAISIKWLMLLIWAAIKWRQLDCSKWNISIEHIHTQQSCGALRHHTKVMLPPDA